MRLAEIKVKEEKKKREKAKLLHNNMGDLTLLHCSNSC